MALVSVGAQAAGAAAARGASQAGKAASSGRAAAAKPPSKPIQVKVSVSHPGADTLGKALAGIHAATGATTNPKTTAGRAAAASQAPTIPNPTAPVQQQATPAPSAFQTIMQGNPPTDAQLNTAAGQYAAGTTQAQINAGLGPLKSAATQISGQQNTAQNRFQAYTGQALGNIQGLGAQNVTNTGAIENAAAQSAQASGAAFGQLGSQAAAAYGGVLSPQAQAALGPLGQFGQAAGANESQYLGNLGTGAGNYLSSLAGNTQAEGLFGQQNLQGYYGRQLASNQASQQGLISSATAKEPALKADMRQQLVNDYLTAAGLKIKGTSAQASLNTSQAALLNAGSLSTYRTNQAATDRINAVSNASYRTGQIQAKAYEDQTTRANDYANQQIKKISNQIAGGNLTEKQRDDLVKERQGWVKLQQTSTTGTSKTANTKAVGNILWAAGAYKGATAIKGAPTSPVVHRDSTGKVTYTTPAVPGTAANPDVVHRILLSNKGTTGAEAEAGYQLGRFGYINQVVAGQLVQQGVNFPSSWTVPHATPGFPGYIAGYSPAAKGTTGRAGAAGAVSPGASGSATAPVTKG